MPTPAPTGGPDASWPHRALYNRVQDALHALPPRFRTSLRIAGIASTDLFTLNTPLGAAFEQSVVDNLNLLRELWDPEERYQPYSFVRQAQVFPDVRLETSAPNVPPEERVLMGIELKGWFLLSKEGEPSFRYKASPEACAPQDLLVVFPWRLDEVISGSPTLMRPFVSEARYAAEHRNHYWSVGRGVTGAAAEIRHPVNAAPYPAKGARFNDEATHDQGKNFGRVARGGLMAAFIETLLEEPISGIPAKHWQAFIKIFSEGADDETVSRRIASIKAGLAAGAPDDRLEALDQLEGVLNTLLFGSGR